MDRTSTPERGITPSRAICGILLCGLLSGCAQLGLSSPEHLSNPLSGAHSATTGSSLTTTHSSDHWYRLGNRYAQQNRPALAERAYRRALEQGDHPKARFNLGLMQIWQGVDNMRKAARKLPNEPRAAREVRYLEQHLAGLGS